MPEVLMQSKILVCLLLLQPWVFQLGMSLMYQFVCRTQYTVILFNINITAAAYMTSQI